MTRSGHLPAALCDRGHGIHAGWQIVESIMALGIGHREQIGRVDDPVDIPVHEHLLSRQQHLAQFRLEQTVGIDVFPETPRDASHRSRIVHDLDGDRRPFRDWSARIVIGIVVRDNLVVELHVADEVAQRDKPKRPIGQHLSEIPSLLGVRQFIDQTHLAQAGHRIVGQQACSDVHLQHTVLGHGVGIVTRRCGGDLDHHACDR